MKNRSPRSNRSKPKPRLSTEQCVEVMNAARRNAKRLASDARRMFDAGSYATALALAILAWEEHGKAMLMVQMALQKGERQRAAIWSDFYKHQPKMFGQLMLTRFKNCKTEQDLQTAWAAAQESVQHVDESMKQAAFYVGVDAGGGVIEPTKAFPRDRVEEFVEGVELLTAKNDEPTPLDFIKLMEKHFGGKFESGTPQDLQNVLIAVGPFLREVQELFPNRPELLDGIVQGLLNFASFLTSATVTLQPERR